MPGWGEDDTNAENTPLAIQKIPPMDIHAAMCDLQPTGGERRAPRPHVRERWRRAETR